MENIIFNLGLPHVGEQIFESLDTPELFNCLEVSETWRELAENVLAKRLKGKMFEACKNGETKVVQLLLEHGTADTKMYRLVQVGAGWCRMVQASTA